MRSALGGCKKRNGTADRKEVVEESLRSFKTGVKGLKFDDRSDDSSDSDSDSESGDVIQVDEIYVEDFHDHQKERNGRFFRTI